MKLFTTRSLLKKNLFYHCRVKFREAKKMISSFPCLPVPSLNNTLMKLIASAKPFLTSEEYCLSEKTINIFGIPGGEGECLQGLILERAAKVDNWLADWWQKYEYLCNRNSLVSSITGLSFPTKNYNSEEAFLEYASKIAAGAIQFKKLLDENMLTRESMEDEPLDMSQYQMIFGTCRIPHDSVDCLLSNPNSQHITVTYRNNFYKVIVREGLAWQNHSAIREQLKEIVKDKSVGPGLGVLTSDCRVSWHRAYTQLRKNQINWESIKSIEDSLFLLCLDSHDSQNKINSSTDSIAHCIHGISTRHNSCNRWFDKTLQFLVGPNGNAGVTFEDSPADVQAVNTLMNFIFTYTYFCSVFDNINWDLYVALSDKMTRRQEFGRRYEVEIPERQVWKNKEEDLGKNSIIWYTDGSTTGQDWESQAVHSSREIPINFPSRDTWN